MLPIHNIALYKFFSLILNIVRRGKKGETENCPDTSFRIIFVTDFPKNLEKIKCDTFLLVVLNHFEGMQLSITSLWYKP